jgi:hypothetical protein
MNLLATACLVASLGGCFGRGYLQDQVRVGNAVSFNSEAKERNLKLPTADEWIDWAAGTTGCTLKLNAAASPGSGGTGTTATFKTYECGAPASSLPSDDARQEHRNEVQSKLKDFSDLICEEHLAGIYATASTINAELGWSTSVLAGAASVVTGEQARKNLAAAAASTNSARSLVDSEVYQGMLVGAIVSKIRTTRDDAWGKIQPRRAKAMKDYGAADAIDDVLAYHNMCSFNVGVSALVKDAGQSSRQADAALKSAVDIAKGDLKQAQDDYDKRKTELDADVTAHKIKKAAEDAELAELRKRITEAEQHLTLMETLAGAYLDAPVSTKSESASATPPPAASGASDPAANPPVAKPN